MLEDGKQGKINMIIALKLDRITRSTRDWETLMDFLEKYNINIAFVNDDINTTTANGKMVSRIMMSVSQNEIERTSEITIIGLEGAIKQGHIPARAPLGYKHIDKKLVPDPLTKEIVPDFYVANATIHFDEHSPHMHIVGVPVKENCKTGLSRQVGKTSIFTKESLVVIQDKMRERCIDEFNIAYGLNSKLKKKEQGKNRDITSYERKLFNERVKELKQEISNLENEVSDLEDNKKSINKQITKLNKDKDDIKDEIDKKKLNNKIVIKSKNQLLDENKKLKEENEHLKSINYQTEARYKDLKERTDYLIYHLNKMIKKLPEFIQNLIDRLFNYNNINLYYFKQQYDSEVKKREQKKNGI